MRICRAEKLAACFLGFSIFAVSAGATSAYLTSGPQILQNRITAGMLGIELTESKWDPIAAEHLLPGSVVAKNPSPVNTGTTSAWVFLKVEVPIRTISVVSEQTREKLPPEKTELFRFVVSDGWKEIKRQEEHGKMVRIFGFYKEAEPFEQLPSLFQKVEFVNYLEGELKQEEKLDMPVEAISIQSNLCEKGTPLITIYESYLQQKTDTVIDAIVQTEKGGGLR